MNIRVSLSKSKVSKRSGFWVSRKVKTWINRVFWLNLYLFESSELISRKKWPPGPEAAVSRAIQGNRSYHGLTDQFNVSNGSISNVMKLIIASSGVIHRFTEKKLLIATPKEDKLLVWLACHILVIRNALKLFYNEICSKTLKVYPFPVEICIGSTVGMSKIKILSVYFCSWTPK
jgi:hypothetical protein